MVLFSIGARIDVLPEGFLFSSEPRQSDRHARLTPYVRSAQALYYFLLANPSPAAGFLDFFVLNPVFQQLERQARIP